MREILQKLQLRVVKITPELAVTLRGRSDHNPDAKVYNRGPCWFLGSEPVSFPVPKPGQMKQSHGVNACQCHILQELQCFQANSVASLACLFCFVERGHVAAASRGLTNTCRSCYAVCGLHQPWPPPLDMGRGPFQQEQPKFGWFGSCRLSSVTCLLQVHWPPKSPTWLPEPHGSCSFAT